VSSADELRALVDRAAIASVLHLGCRMLDENDLDLLSSIYADGCRVRFRPGHEHERVGLEQLRAYYAHAGARLAATSHHLSNIDIDFFDDDTADVRSYFYAWQRYAGGDESQTWGQYVDRMGRTPSGWRILDRQLLVAGSSSTGDRYPTLRRGSD
jgi:hypothetical protein